MAVKAIPEGYHSVTPYLMVADAAKLIDFLKQAFGAVETERVARPDGGIMHAEVRMRPQRRGRRSGGQHLVDRDPHRGRATGRTGAARGRGDEEAGEGLSVVVG